jgi:hypothetical protein
MKSLSSKYLCMRLLQVTAFICLMEITSAMAGGGGLAASMPHFASDRIQASRDLSVTYVHPRPTTMNPHATVATMPYQSPIKGVNARARIHTMRNGRSSRSSVHQFNIPVAPKTNIPIRISLHAPTAIYVDVKKYCLSCEVSRRNK